MKSIIEYFKACAKHSNQMSIDKDVDNSMKALYYRGQRDAYNNVARFLEMGPIQQKQHMNQMATFFAQTEVERLLGDDV